MRRFARCRGCNRLACLQIDGRYGVVARIRHVGALALRVRHDMGGMAADNDRISRPGRGAVLAQQNQRAHRPVVPMTAVAVMAVVRTLSTAMAVGGFVLLPHNRTGGEQEISGQHELDIMQLDADRDDVHGSVVQVDAADRASVLVGRVDEARCSGLRIPREKGGRQRQCRCSGNYEGRIELSP